VYGNLTRWYKIEACDCLLKTQDYAKFLSCI